MAKANHKCRCLRNKNTVILWLEIELSATSPPRAGRGAEVGRAHHSEQHRSCSAGFSPSREGPHSAPSQEPKPVQDTINLFPLRFITASALAPMRLNALVPPLLRPVRAALLLVVPRKGLEPWSHHQCPPNALYWQVSRSMMLCAKLFQQKPFTR